MIISINLSPPKLSLSFSPVDAAACVAVSLIAPLNSLYIETMKSYSLNHHIFDTPEVSPVKSISCKIALQGGRPRGALPPQILKVLTID
jgi:hypothetical protein